MYRRPWIQTVSKALATPRKTASVSHFSPKFLKNNQDETVGIFIQEKVWLKNSPRQSKGGGLGEGVSEYRNSLWRATGPLRKPVVSMWGRNGVVSE